MKIKTFFNERKRDEMAEYLDRKKWCIHAYRYVAGGSLIYCVKFWR